MDPDSTSLALPLIGYACFTLLAAFFSAAERSFMGLNDSLLQRQAAEGDAVARRIVRMIEKPAVFLSTVRAGNTLCEMLGLACLSPVATRLFIARVYAGAATPDWAYPAFLLVVTLLIGALSLTLGDILPGRIGDFFPEGAARRLSGPMRLFSLLLRPLVWLMLALAGLGLRLLGQNPDKEPDTVTEEEIRMLVTVGEEKGAIEQSERQMINNIFEFDDRFVTEVMTHRMEMTALEDTATLDEAVAVARQTGYSRIPVYHEDIDNITGVLYAKDLLGFVNDRNNSEGFELRKMLHRAFFIPDTAKCTELFREFQQKQLHMAIVIDEYGGTYGMVTMEDLLEAIVGDIQDEYDREESEYQKISDTEYDIDGRLPLDDVEELLGADLPEDSDYDTIGGVIVDRLEGLPANGEHPSVQIGRVLFTVLEVSDRRIAKLRAQLLPEEPPEEEERWSLFDRREDPADPPKKSKRP